MKSAQNKLKIDVTGSTARNWPVHLAPVCQDDITPFFVMEQTARTGP
ncbi:MAG: hypothetical protein WAV20_06150 [Blastocatellia bacterium]